MIAHSSPYMNEDDFLAVEKILICGMIAKGKKSEEFRALLQEYLKSSRLELCQNGTEALILALHSLKIGVNDEVILPTYVCEADYIAVVSVGAIPVLCDINDNWLIDPTKIEKLITKNTKAIIIVHTFGISCDVNEIKKFDIPIIEDCCHAFGGFFMGNSLGTIGDVGIFSFHATKCLTTGEGGALSLNSKCSKEGFDEYRKEKYINIGITDVQAVIGIVQLEKYPFFLDRRKEIARRYMDTLPLEFTQKMRANDSNSIFFRFLLNIEGLDFEKVKEKFFNRGIAVRKGVDVLLHERYLKLRFGCPNSEKVFSQTLSVPIYPALTDEQVSIVINVANSIFREVV